MEIKETKNGKVIIMSFVDAEHCNMSYNDLKFECSTIGLDLDKELPIALLIQVDGGLINQHNKIKNAKFNNIQSII